MNIEELRDYCLSKKGVTEEFPFDETTLVFKVLGKMFVLTDLEGHFSLNLKCDPGKAIELRERYPSVHPGYHMNKKHWNTVVVDGTVKDKLLYKWIDDSYQLVINSLSGKEKAFLGQ
ncbi:MAG: MmcQ/YjbR family DNA-binding protein [Bacteroidetes bacterium]|nr:MmcQ/YjbR family DNA-binding protein [Bacteroidota bacterium]